jgi:hypothetical protein
MKPSWRRSPARIRVGGLAAGGRFLRLPIWKVRRRRAATGFEQPWRPARVVRLDTSIFLASGTTQLVEGASLIRK